MMFLLLFCTRFVFSTEPHSAECVPRCEIVEMAHNVVPSQYRKCVCDLILENNNLEYLSNQEAKCVSNYRSLKFRDKETGAVVLHKAVVGICSSSNSREYVNQAEFEKEEKKFRANRSFKIASSSSFFPSLNHSQKHSWIDGIRNNIMQLYRKPDGHLRFG